MEEKITVMPDYEHHTGSNLTIASDDSFSSGSYDTEEITLTESSNEAEETLTEEELPEPIGEQLHQLWEVACEIRVNMFEIGNIFLFSHITVKNRIISSQFYNLHVSNILFRLITDGFRTSTSRSPFSRSSSWTRRFS